MGIWIGSAGLGYVISGIASFGIGHIHASLENWKLIFLIWGAITTAWGLVLVFFLPGSPLKTKFLTDHERVLALNRVKVNNTGIENREFKMKQLYEALSDMKTWFLFLFAVASNSPNGGLTTVRGTDHQPSQANISTVPRSYHQGDGLLDSENNPDSDAFRRHPAHNLPACMVSRRQKGPGPVLTPCSFAASYIKNARLVTMLVCLVPFLAGVCGLWLISNDKPYGRLVCLWISFSYTATWTLSMAVATANTAGHTKKITTNALLLIGYCLGNFIGPFFFKGEQAPTYNLGVGMMFFCIALQVICIVGIGALFWVRNKKRRSLMDGGDPTCGFSSREYERGLLDETDLENPYFEVCFLKEHATSVLTDHQYVY